MLGQRRGEELKHGLDSFCGTESEDMMVCFFFCLEMNVRCFFKMQTNKHELVQLTIPGDEFYSDPSAYAHSHFLFPSLETTEAL